MPFAQGYRKYHCGDGMECLVEQQVDRREESKKTQEMSLKSNGKRKEVTREMEKEGK